MTEAARAPTVIHQGWGDALRKVPVGTEAHMGAVGLVRAVMIGLVVASALADPLLKNVARGRVLAVATVWVLVLAGGEILRRDPRAPAILARSLVALDGVLITAATFAGGGVQSPLFLLAFVHVITVTLLVGYISGIRIAVWDAALLQLAATAQMAGLIDFLDPNVDEVPSMTVRTVALLAVTLVTAGASHLNQREMRRSRQSLQLLLSTGHALTFASDIQSSASVAMSALLDDLEFERATVLVQRVGHRPMVATQTRGSPPEHGVGARGTQAKLFDEPLLRTDPAQLPDEFLRSTFEGTENVVVVNLRGRLVTGYLAGALGRQRRRQVGIADRLVSSLEAIASQLSSALDRQELDGIIAEMAATDGLTGVANRHRFDIAFDEMIETAEATRRPLSVLVVDLDHFKRINDEYGHQAGDKVLRAVARHMRMGRRSEDLVARYGGEEFAILLPETSCEAALRVAERLRKDLAAMRRPRPITVSIGVSCSEQDGLDATTLFEAADQALYEAKRAGRNRVETSWGAKPIQGAGTR